MARGPDRRALIATLDDLSATTTPVGLTCGSFTAWVSVTVNFASNRAFPVAAQKVCNSLSDDIVSCASLSTFCRLMETFSLSVS